MSNNEPVDRLVEKTIESFWDTVPPVWGRIRDNVRRIAMEQFQLSIEQFHILRLIRKGHHSVSQLAAKQLISRPAISQAVDVLVKKGMVSRLQSPDDRRFVRLDLTESGGGLLDAIFEKNRDWMRGVMSCYSPEELALLQQGLGILKKMEEAEITG